MSSSQPYNTDSSGLSFIISLIASTVLNAILGVSYTDLVIDFELTSYSSIITRECKRSHLREGQWDHWPALESELKKLSTWDANDSLKDNIERYLTQKAGVKQSTIDKIREIMLEPAE